MFRKKPDVDVVKDVLDAAGIAFPASEFIKSLTRQYEERGGLSKKQLEGLYSKAQKIKNISPSKLATLEAMIRHRPTRYKSAPPPPKPLYEKDEATGKIIDEILAKFPEHKRVLFLQTKYRNNEVLSAAELDELKRLRARIEQLSK